MGIHEIIFFFFFYIGHGGGNGGGSGGRLIELDNLVTAFGCLLNSCFFLFQEVHDLLKDYDLKYCYVDRNKRTGKVSILSI